MRGRYPAAMDSSEVPTGRRSGSRGAWFALVVALAMHLVLLYRPGSPEPSEIELFPHLDKVAHLALFGVPAFLIRRVTTAWWPIILLAVHAPVSELVQYLWIPRRNGDPFDLLADGVGIALGVWAANRFD